MDRVATAVRCRPVFEDEKDCSISAIVLQNSNEIVVPDNGSFKFKHVFGEKTKQNEIYEELVHPLVQKFIQGFNGCVLAYGQTGSGKTYTMGTDNVMGTDKVRTPGIVQNALEEIFSIGDLEISLSFLEVYKEEVLDLLISGKKKMNIIDFKPQGLTIARVDTCQLAFNLMEEGLKNRHIGTTNANIHSSRSHAILTIYMTKKSESGISSSKLYLVDLAGSESVSDVTGDTRKEGVMINKGLLQLGMVMSALSSGKQDHIPYRGSALTTILKDTLSPQNFVVLIGCVSPLDKDRAMTRNTLAFTQRVGNIKLMPTLKQTPFKKPGSFLSNKTIATPGRCGSIKRPALRPFNNTFNSPRTPLASNKKMKVMSTPMNTGIKPLFCDPTPILKEKRRSSSEWNLLNISSSTTVLENTLSQTKEQKANQTAGILPSAENETWLRSLITDVIREELKSHSILLSSTMLNPPTQPRRSARLSKGRSENSFFVEHESDQTVVETSANQAVSDNTVIQKEKLSATIQQDQQSSFAPRRSIRLSLKNQSKVNDSLDDSFNEATSSEYKRSVKNNKNLLKSKLIRRSKRLSIFTHVEPEHAQKKINLQVLEVLQKGNLKRLQSLPTIGPKTAVIISNHRLLNGPMKSLKDLQNVRGLSANFSKRFFLANNIVIEED